MPADVVASVLGLQALEGRSDREAVEALTFDLRWKAACGWPIGWNDPQARAGLVDALLERALLPYGLLAYRTAPGGRRARLPVRPVLVKPPLDGRQVRQWVAGHAAGGGQRVRNAADCVYLRGCWSVPGE